jgi:hypothetical protein
VPVLTVLARRRGALVDVDLADLAGGAGRAGALEALRVVVGEELWQQVPPRHGRVRVQTLVRELKACAVEATRQRVALVDVHVALLPCVASVARAAESVYLQFSKPEIMNNHDLENIIIIHFIRHLKF